MHGCRQLQDGHCPPLGFGHFLNAGQTEPRYRNEIEIVIEIEIEGQKMGFGQRNWM
jgi:hypothetical protein